MALFAGLGLGLVAAIMVAILLSSGGGDDNAPAQSANTRVAVSVARDVPARTRLTRELLQVQTYDVKDVDADAFTSTSQVINRVTARNIQAGEVIVPDAVSVTTGEGLTFGLAEGMRAISISVSEVILAGGNIAPGNRVDIIGRFEIGSTTNIGSIVELISGKSQQIRGQPADDAHLILTILQNVRILAVAQDLSPEVRERTGEVTEAGAIAENEVARANPRASTVTLEVTPQQAQSMAAADLLGTLRLSLRPFGDDDDVEISPIIIRLD
jgi:pilus assembly protein CpaB